MADRRRGLALGELLALVAVIGVLAAMLVPVYERQRETARSLTCLSNQEKIVSALRIYMADNDNALPPDEHRPEVIAYFDTCPGGASYGEEHCRRPVQANPYLRWPVVIDAYLPSREVWQCPSAAIVAGARWIVPGPDWFGYLVSHAGEWGKVTSRGDGPCYTAFPPGWGGDVTDSLVQGRLAVELLAPLYGKVATGAFIESIGNTLWYDLNLSEVPSPERFVIAGDGGVQASLGMGTLAYPEICALECGNEACGNQWGHWYDWEVCAEVAAACGLYRYAPSNGSFLGSPALRAPYARHRAPFVSSGPLWTRNGVNITFLDGHSQWIASETLIEKVKQGELGGINHWGPTQDCGFAERYPGVPTIY